MKCAVIFGGTGFIGTYFAKYLVEHDSFSKVYLYDLESIEKKKYPFRQKLVYECPLITEVIGDVREPITWQPEEEVSLIANFAAVHREPGHKDFEYYATNIRGADNVCAWAEKVSCKSIIFTSSISPYGPSEEQKDESSLPTPQTAYGGSKLVAEKIHQIWLAGCPELRRLVIVRPGVVFGPGEGGNVSRLIKAVIGRYFFYMGNRDTRKAGTYVKELCSAIQWVLLQQEKEGRNFTLFNMSMNPGPSIQEYVEAVCSIAKIKRQVPVVPYRLLLGVAHFIDFFARPLAIKHPFSPIRIRKLVRSNNIHPGYLVKNQYPYRYNLKSAFMDWKAEAPEEWK
ncbi:NAD(P)-dependent oxidoreductase [Pseudomonas citronellolis]|uniref:NAD-dependent epimerase/dehydratase family protein n=1 Tax=Pseudomonas citronellolis TaxID=53408 RepID=UPI00248E1D3D|nr:NAD(P)-dependent oxidoreductase [Pseudomonas citronellolis]